jgi:uncharacterized membrane protein
VPDPLDPVAPGEVSPLVTSAATVNAVLEAARWHRGRKGAGPRGPGVTDDPLTPASLVLVQNNTGSTLLAWSVCTPTGMVVDPDTDEASGHRARRRPAFVVGAPAAADDPVLITVEDIAADKIGKAAVAGCTVAYVNRTSSAHDFAAPAAGVTTSLASAESGPVRLLAATGTGTKKFYVVLGDGAGAGGDPGFFARLTSIGGSPLAWKWYAQKLNNLGVYVDDGSESSAFNAIPAPFDGLTAAPATLAGRRVWMIPSTEPGFYEFLPYGPPNGTATGSGASWSGEASDTWVDSGVTVTLPAAGRYLIFYTCAFAVFTSGPAAPGSVFVRLVETAGGTEIPGSYRDVSEEQGAINLFLSFSACQTFLYDAAASVELEIQLQVSCGGSTFDGDIYGVTSSGSSSRIGYLRVT